MAQFANLEEINQIMANANNEIRLLTADATTCTLYNDHKVSINLRNVEGNSKKIDFLLDFVFFKKSINNFTNFYFF